MTQSPRLMSAWGATFVAVPLLGVAYQYCAERTAQALAGLPLGLAWLTRALGEPWALGLLGLETISFAAWMYVLSEADLSVAFPLTAISYVLVVGMGWIALHETVSPQQVLGAVSILAGVWLLKPAGEHPQ